MYKFLIKGPFNKNEKIYDKVVSYTLFCQTRCSRTLLVRTTVTAIKKSVIHVSRKSQQDYWYHVQLSLKRLYFGRCFMDCNKNISLL